MPPVKEKSLLEMKLLSTGRRVVYSHHLKNLQVIKKVSKKQKSCDTLVKEDISNQ